MLTDLRYAFRLLTRAPRFAVALVNQTLATRLWGTVSPLGAMVELSSDWGTNPVRIVGVIRDFRDRLSGVGGPRPEIYLSLAQQPAAAGIAAGVVLAYNQWHLLRRLSTAVERFDPAVYAAAAVALIAFAAASAWLPARAALRVDPAVALRTD